MLPADWTLPLRTSIRPVRSLSERAREPDLAPSSERYFEPEILRKDLELALHDEPPARLVVVTRIEQRITRIWADESGEKRQSLRLARWEYVQGRSRAAGMGSLSRPRYAAALTVGGLATLFAVLAATPRTPSPALRNRAGTQEIRMIVPPAAEDRRPTKVAAVAKGQPLKKVTEKQNQAVALLAVASTPVASKAAASKPVEAAPVETAPVTEDLSIAAATQRALGNESVELWTEQGRDGFVAAGPIALKDGRRCREVTKWERGAPQGAAETRLECRLPE
jgi:hypothetical protein